MARPAALVFDLDGTLIDSRRDITTAVNRTRADFGLQPLTLEQVVAMVGEGARVLVERAMAGELPPDRLDEAFELYRSHYQDVSLDTTRAYPGVESLLETLSRELPEIPMALLTNKGESLSRQVLEGLGLARYFREVLGGDSLPSRKPDPAGLRFLADRFDVPVESLLLIGDSWVDAETARAAGCLFALVEWGFPRAPGDVPADLRFSEAGKLEEAIRTWSQAAPP